MYNIKPIIMKKIVTSVVILLFVAGVAAQEQSQKFVIDVTSTDNKVYQSVLLIVGLMSESHPNSNIEVFAYGEAVPMFMENKSVVAVEIKKYRDNPNIVFTACEVSMRLFNIEEEELLAGVGTVENAIDEIINRQALGWGYIKSGN